MNCYSIPVKTRSQVFVCGVDGAGKRSFISTFFPSCRKKRQTVLQIKNRPQKVLVVIILDSIHLQNIAEANLLQDIKDIVSAEKNIDFSVLIVLGKTDLIYNRRLVPNLIKDIYQDYKGYLDGLSCARKGFYAFSALATQRTREFLSRKLDNDDMDDVKDMLVKIGRHLPDDISPESIKQYVINHKRAFAVFSGENHIHLFLQKWKENL